jgi:methylglutaconyl-CoA hydratase
MSDRFRIETSDGIATLTLTRPEANNAFDDIMIVKLTAALERLAADSDVEAIVVAGEGKNFCAGADIEWMKRVATYGHEENLRDAEALAKLMSTLDQMPKPTIARVQGAVYGGGVGLVACCDIAIATDDARFCLSEVKLGLIPAVISPYVVGAIGSRAARRYFQTAEVFDATRAKELGLVHEVVPASQFDQQIDAINASLKQGAPQAKAAAKALVKQIAHRPVNESLINETAAAIAEMRSKPEAKEGLSAFLERRKPNWRGDAG